MGSRVLNAAATMLPAAAVHCVGACCRAMAQALRRRGGVGHRTVCVHETFLSVKPTFKESQYPINSLAVLVSTCAMLLAACGTGGINLMNCSQMRNFILRCY